MGKNTLICLIDQLSSDTKFRDFLEKLDNESFDIHIFNGVIVREIQPHNILDILLENFKKDISEQATFYFLSNIKDLLFLTYRIYHQIFNGFLYFNDSIQYEVRLDPIYKFLLEKEVLLEEELFKPIFLFSFETDIFKHTLVNEKCCYLANVNELVQIRKKNEVNKFYYYQQNYS